MSVSQCVGPTLDIDDSNVLDVRLAGVPAAAALPATGNGLRADPGRGLWAPAEHTALQISEFRRFSQGGVIVNPGGRRLADMMLIQVTNPSPSRTMLCTLLASTKLVFAIKKNDTTGWGMLTGYDVNADVTSTVPVVTQYVRRDQGLATAEAGMVYSHTEIAQFLLGPGGGAKLRVQAGVECYDSGYVRVTDIWQGARGIGVTL
jgi:hypothetical protein